MSKGFIVLAQNTADVNYVSQAYALALSIKNTQSEVSNISLVTNDPVPDTYKSVFDNIIEIPWVDPSKDTRYKAEHRWKLYYVTPYDETIVLDSDMLVLEDLADWWTFCKNYDLQFCSKVKNYKLETITNSFYRKAFVANDLPNSYFGLHYFKKNQAAFEFYKVLEFVCNNWEWCWDKFAPLEYQRTSSLDLATAISIEILMCHDRVFDKHSPLEFIHMKPHLQGWDYPSDNWQDTIMPVLNTKGDLIVGNIKQSKLFHYCKPDFISPRIIQRLEELADGKI